LIEVYQGNCGEQAGALVQRGYSLFWTRCEGLKGPPPCLVHLVDENGQFCGAISFASLGSADSEGARQTVCRRSRRGALATCCAVRLAARAKVMTRELAPGDVPLIVEREPGLVPSRAAIRGSFTLCFLSQKCSEPVKLVCQTCKASRDVLQQDGPLLGRIGLSCK
jgi:hypothetical protein